MDRYTTYVHTACPTADWYGWLGISNVAALPAESSKVIVPQRYLEEERHGSMMRHPLEAKDRVLVLLLASTPLHASESPMTNHKITIRRFRHGCRY